MNHRLIPPLRIAAVTAATLGLTVAALGPAAAAESDVSVVNTETVQVYTDATGSVESRRIYEQLALTGQGTVELRNPVEESGLRNLDGFGGYDVEDGAQVTTVDVDGEQHLRTVSDYDGELPLEVSVAYFLDGERVEPGDVVGEGGLLDVRYTVRNVTGEKQEISFAAGNGDTITKTVDVAIPMVGSLTTVLPSGFTEVASKQANMAGDGKGGMKLTFTMTLFPPIGSTTAEFGYTARITDGVVPEATMTALPVNPLQSPTLRTAADSYQGGAATGAELTDGATQIDANLLKLRDGAAELLAGLVQLRDGASELEAGLAGKAAPGSRKLADGALELEAGLAGKAAPGSRKLADGALELDSGLGRLADGAGRLADGAGRLAGGTGDAAAGGRKLADGLGRISGGLQQLADADAGLPYAKNGALQLKQGIDLLITKLGTTDDPATVIGGLAKLEGGLAQLRAGAGDLHGGLNVLAGNVPSASPGLKGANAGVGQVKAGLDDALKAGGSLDQLAGGLGQVKANFCVAMPTPTAVAQCNGTLDALLAGVADSRGKLTAASAGLGQVSTGLATAIGGLETKLIPGASLLSTKLGEAEAGATKLKAGATEFKGGMLQVSEGMDRLTVGITKAVAGVLQLSAGAGSAYDGSLTLAGGLGQLDAGAAKLSAGAGELADGSGRAAEGSGRLAAGADELAAGLGDAANGSGRLAAGADELADGLGDAANGSGRLADGLKKAAAGAPKLRDGAQRLSDEGTKKLVEAGDATAQEYGELYATIAAGAERADAEKMAYGAPEGATGLTAYSFQIQGEDGEAGRNVARGVGGIAVLGAAGAAFAFRRRLI